MNYEVTLAMILFWYGLFVFTWTVMMFKIIRKKKHPDVVTLAKVVVMQQELIEMLDEEINELRNKMVKL